MGSSLHRRLKVLQSHFVLPHIWRVVHRTLPSNVVQWVARLTREQLMPVSREYEAHSKTSVVSLSKKLPSLLSTG